METLTVLGLFCYYHFVIRQVWTPPIKNSWIRPRYFVTSSFGKKRELSQHGD